jgi:Fibronectin type III domain
MRAARVILLLVLINVFGVATSAPAIAARPLATPQFTSAVVVDSRTVILSWTPVKGAHHYVVEYAPAMRVYTTETSVTITDLYPGDGHYFTVRAETRRNVPSGTSDPIIVPTPPEGPLSPSAAPYFDGIRIWWTSGIGCATYELATVAPDGTYSGPVQPIAIENPTMWYVAQEAGTTVTYAVRCASSYGLYSPWSDPTVVTLDAA